MLAGLPQAPSAINPLNSPESAMKRRSHVLDRMYNYELISKEEYNEANKQPITTTYHGRPIELHAPFIAEMARQYMVENYGEDAYSKGYQVITTVDSKAQDAANNALTRAILEYDQRHGFRGPIKRLKPTSDYFSELQEIPKVNVLIPAAVTEINDRSVNALLKTGQNITISWDGLSWVKPYAQSANEIVKVGDVIYVVHQANQKWLLTQIPKVEAAIVALDTNTGGIISLVGGFDYERNSFNRATQSARQPGSSFKPFIYAAALDNNFTTASIINDAPIMQEDPQADEWRPQNYTKEFYGPTRLRSALIYTRNLVSIRVLQALGLPTAIDAFSRMGFEDSSLPRGLSLALGTNNISPLNLAAAYTIFPNNGRRSNPYYIKAILDTYNREIATTIPNQARDLNNDAPLAITPQTAYLVTSMLQDVIKLSSGRMALKLGRGDLAGKTGTTNDYLDGWFAGYNRDIVATTWMGFDEPKSLREYSRTTALPIWVYFMEQTLKGKPDSIQPEPPGLVTAKIDPTTGLLARPGQENAIYEIFTDATVPTSIAKTSDFNQEEQGNDLLEADYLF